MKTVEVQYSCDILGWTNEPVTITPHTRYRLNADMYEGELIYGIKIGKVQWWFPLKEEATLVVHDIQLLRHMCRHWPDDKKEVINLTRLRKVS